MEKPKLVKCDECCDWFPENEINHDFGLDLCGVCRELHYDLYGNL